MKKSVTYFNFGFLLTALVVIVQIVLMLVERIIEYQGPEFFALILPPAIMIVLAFVWYKREQVFLKPEQYLIAIMPLVFFLASGLALAYKDYLSFDYLYIVLAIFLPVYFVQQWCIYRLASKLHETNYIKKFQGKSLLYLIACSLLMWTVANCFFL